MIGRFASGLGRRLPGLLVAGVILLAMGAWFATAPLRHAYPESGDLAFFEGTAVDAIEVRKRRGAFLRFLRPDALTFQAALDPGKRVVLYDSSMPHYDALKSAVASGAATYALWDEAGDEENGRLIWGLDTPEGSVVTVAETVANLKASRAAAVWLPGAIALFGLALSVLGWRARSRM